ncbi:hypothetical protein AKJ41_00630 [candidate division MSBL1 archaeon SCGC-AAA259O05]|uniref:Uncharacterized protein n=1 Tax=candidate division MSBL1 archaeon SCGC-AAA259O05 TaxID=1698271 RepID=A0A133V5H9_9EURY|nr:hypothetical protein AKJ41_00630 [candidate division MSBL1 archaeon SCGC-AAA259O05]
MMEFWNRLRKRLKRRSPWLAALLNVVWGLGYLYAGRKKLVGLSLLSLVWPGLTVAGMIQSGSEVPVFLIYWTTIGAPLFVCLALARDAYIEAEKGNREKERDKA